MTEPDAWQKKMNQDQDWTILHWNKEAHVKFEEREPLFSGSTIQETVEDVLRRNTYRSDGRLVIESEEFMKELEEEFKQKPTEVDDQ